MGNLQSEIVTAVVTGLFSGAITGLVAFITMRQDIKWLKESVTELRTLFFKYVQENHKG